MYRVIVSAALLAVSTSAEAQCFNRNGCDPSALEVRTQLSIAIPVAESGDTSEALKTMDDARRQISALAEKEADAIKSVYGADSKLKSFNTNSSLQDNGFRGGRMANVSASSTYEVKKAK